MSNCSMTVYLISDTHFNHGNIINYCDRPFEDVNDMNSTIINNWNKKVLPNDKVFFAGDLAMSRPSKAVEFYKELKGNMLMLRGNHDLDLDINKAPFNILESFYIEYKDYKFYISHYPINYQQNTDRDDNRREPDYSNPPNWFDGWNIHGHVHNNDLENFPFINQDNKMINVGVDVINFEPINLDYLIEIIETGKSYKTIEDYES